MQHLHSELEPGELHHDRSDFSDSQACASIS
jgi:hypothetical protein